MRSKPSGTSARCSIRLGGAYHVVKITDFGIAQAMNNLTITHNKGILGSAHYFSPEQARGEHVDFKSDIYSLGVVMYEMVSGHVP